MAERDILSEVVHERVCIQKFIWFIDIDGAGLNFTAENFSVQNGTKAFDTIWVVKRHKQ